MVFSKTLFGLDGVSVAGAVLLTMGSPACGSNSGGSDGSGGSVVPEPVGGAWAIGDPDPCPLSACKAVDKECFGLVDNKGLQRFGLRIAELDVGKPAKLSTGFLATLIAGAVMPNNEACNLPGAGTFSWLLQFDTDAKTLTTGGAAPVADPTTGYSFSNGIIGGALVVPATWSDVTIDADGSFIITEGKDLRLPIFTSPTDLTAGLILPLRQARISSGTLSASRNCVGFFNPGGLSMSCPDPDFLPRGTIDAVILLEDADEFIWFPINQSLCAFLTGSGQANLQGVTVCERDGNGKITFAGDACSQAGQTCTDSLTFHADYAASSVNIH